MSQKNDVSDFFKIGLKNIIPEFQKSSFKVREDLELDNFIFDIEL